MWSTESEPFVNYGDYYVPVYSVEQNATYGEGWRSLYYVLPGNMWEIYVLNCVVNLRIL